MLTDNFKKWQKFVLTNPTVSDTPQEIGEALVSSAANGTTTEGLTHILCSASNCAETLSLVNRSLLYFGQGSTPSSVSDVRMETPIVPGRSITVVTGFSGEYKNHNTIITLSGEVENIGQDAITIREIGWVKGLMLSTSQSSAASIKYVLMAREVLSEPVVLGNGESKSFEFKIVI